MLAMARYLRKKYGEKFKLVFIGPCIAKKAERKEVDELLTFIELRMMFKEKGIYLTGNEKSDFDLPAGGKGTIFPISRGLMQTVSLPGDDLERVIIVAEGRDNFQEAIHEDISLVPSLPNIWNYYVVRDVLWDRVPAKMAKNSHDGPGL